MSENDALFLNEARTEGRSCLAYGSVEGWAVPCGEDRPQASAAQQKGGKTVRKPVILAAVVAASLGLFLADSGPNHQVRNMHFGVSGSNVKDITSRFCCGGTLG